MKVLLLDIETSPNLAYVWGIWEQNVNINHMVSTSQILCWSAKWLGDKQIMFDSIRKSSYKAMLKRMHMLLNEADVVVHYNGRRFDIPTLNREFLLHGFTPPSPYKQVDMFHITKHKFKFLSNKMDYVAKQLKLGQKTPHGGFQLWIDCLAKKPEAWKTMEEYNKHDVELLEKIYVKMRPWIDNHPNRNMYDQEAECIHCGSDHKQKRGTEPRRGGLYQRFQCMDCGGWFSQLKNGKFTQARG